MATISKVFEPEQTATQLTNITTEQFFDLTPTLDGWDGIVIQIKVTFPAAPTDNLVVSIYGNVKATPEWDTLPIMQFEIPKVAGGSNSLSITLTGHYQYRVGVKRSGSTDTIPSADMTFRRWKWQSV